MAAARAQNNRAMARFLARNGNRGQQSAGRLPHRSPPELVKGLVKGSAVALADGAHGKVSYLDPNLRIARVRTEDGRNLTVRQSELRALPS